MPAVAEDRPPYVQFERRPEEDRNASIEAGHYVAKDVNYALITPMGSKDKIERVATEWLANIERECGEGRFPRNWLEAFKAAYAAWEKNLELPETGSPIIDWPALSPAQVKMLLNWNVRTIEDLSVANEETITRLGMGGRALKQRAVDWLATAKDSGKVAEEVSSLRAANTDLVKANEDLRERLTALERIAEASKGSGGKKL